MPTITNPEVIEAISTAFIACNLDMGAGLRAAGYSDSYSKSAKGLRLYDRPDLRAGIKRARLALVAKTGFTKAEAHAELDENRQLALELKQPSAATQASTAKIRLYGMDQQESKQEATVIVISPPVAAKRIESKVIDNEV